VSASPHRLPSTTLDRTYGLSIDGNTLSVSRRPPLPNFSLSISSSAHATGTGARAAAHTRISGRWPSHGDVSPACTLWVAQARRRIAHAPAAAPRAYARARRLLTLAGLSSLGITAGVAPVARVIKCNPVDARSRSWAGGARSHSC
jgi:hypothetical protein